LSGDERKKRQKKKESVAQHVIEDCVGFVSLSMKCAISFCGKRSSRELLEDDFGMDAGGAH